MMVDWIIPGLLLLAVVAIIAAVLGSLRHPHRGLGTGRRPRHARPADPLYRHATHYFASGALPRWEP